jgi:microsomal dipeptidase-like Zn-dependent dipeptidase
MLVDLHAHFPMHLKPGRKPTHDHVQDYARLRRTQWIVGLISRLFNYQGPGDTPSVTEELMAKGGVKVALSVLYAPFDEMDIPAGYGAPPQARYVRDVLEELDLVESHVRDNGQRVALARSPSELATLLNGDLPVLIHAIEGGFQLGATQTEVRANVAKLAARGVAYITVAHLFWRQVATNAPALPFLPDWLYNRIFRQPDEGLTELGRTTIEAMMQQGILVDVTHMSRRSIKQTLDLMDELDPKAEIPVLATHQAYAFGGLQYSLDDETIKRIAGRGGVIGCILCKHYISSGLKKGELKTAADSVSYLSEHINMIRKLTGSHEHTGIGSDLDGYIKPALPGLEHMGLMGELQSELRKRYPDDVDAICSGNALRVLTKGWQRRLR